MHTLPTRTTLPRPFLRSLTPLLAFVLAAALLLLPAASFAQTSTDKKSLTPAQREALLERAEEMVKGRAYAAGVDFIKRWPEILEKHKERLDAATEIDSFTREINRALSELGISHLEFVSPEAAKQLNRTSMAGIGITSELVDGGVRVVKLVEKAPAQKAGMQIGDVIVEVDGKPYKSTDQIRGPAGTTVKLKVDRDDGTTAEFTITRAEFSIREPEKLTPLGDEAFVLSIPTFSTGYDRDNIQNLIREARKARYLIVDLRNNGGGDFGNMVHFLSCFLPPNTQIGTQVSRELAARFEEETGGDPSDPVAVAKWASSKVRTRRSLPVKPFEGKVAVLINRASASASEIVAAALRELRDAPLVGSQTAGAVLVSTYSPVGNGFMMKVPLSEWVTIKGLRLEGNPLVADVQLPFSRRVASEDNSAAEKALERLKQDQ